MAYLADYKPDDFDLKPPPQPAPGAPHECDLVMKGGVTSGVVYPYAILELARVFRFRSIGGTSAGAIAASFAAAAEYARQVHNDPKGFLRLQERCEALPAILESLFQPSPHFRGLMQLFLAMQSGRGWVFRTLWTLVITSWLTILVGAAAGGRLLWWLGGWQILDSNHHLDLRWTGGGDTAAAALGAIVGVIVALAIRLFWLIFLDLPKWNYGLCPGSTQRGGKTLALTDWMHDSLQYIAFGPKGRADPLTFRDLVGPDPDKPVVELRMITTNLGLSRPHTLPTLNLIAEINIGKWSRLFPASVIGHLQSVSRGSPQSGCISFPKELDLPVLVATRLSLSFPVLFETVPLEVLDIEGARLSEQMGGPKEPAWKSLRFTDGGISSNFPVHLFDSLLPSRPTFALSLDDLPDHVSDDPDPKRRVQFAKTANDGVGRPAREFDKLLGFAFAILGAAKDWQDQLLGAMPGQRERIARVYLSKQEGGLNLTMPPDRSRQLMSYGREVGLGFAQGALDFNEHRWRRALVVYHQLERQVGFAHNSWEKGFGDFLKAYIEGPDVPKSYRRVSMADRRNMTARLGAFAGLQPGFEPGVTHPEDNFPKSPGALRIVPEI